jgi:DNA-binding protein YbaB
MKTKFLLFLAVLGMGLGVFACEKDGEDAVEVTSSAENVLKKLEKADKEFSKYFEEVNEKSGGKLALIIKSHSGNPEGLNSDIEFNKLVDIKKIETLSNQFNEAYNNALKNYKNKEFDPLVTISYKKIIGEYPNKEKTNSFYGLPCCSQLIADLESSSEELGRCLTNNWSIDSWYFCRLEYNFSRDFAEANYMRCLQDHY